MPPDQGRKPPVVPIARLNPYARFLCHLKVIKKHEMATWKNDKGEGRRFSVEFTDEAGDEIKVPSFARLKLVTRCALLSLLCSSH